MSLLVRRIEAGKWLQNNIINGAPVSADAITNCTKTKDNKISTWSIPNEMAIDEAVLAMSAAAQDFDALDIVVLNEAVVAQSGLTVQASDGVTPVAGLVHTHRNIVGLTYPALGAYAQLIVEEFRTNRVKRFTRAQLRKLVKQALENGRVSENDLSDSLKLKLH